MQSGRRRTDAAGDITEEIVQGLEDILDELA
jgi:hypothetical protein